MKKRFYILSIILIATLFSSCKKSFNCTCTKPELKEAVVSQFKMSEEDAQNNCNALSADWSVDGGSCVLSSN